MPAPLSSIHTTHRIQVAWHMLFARLLTGLSRLRSTWDVPDRTTNNAVRLYMIQNGCSCRDVGKGIPVALAPHMHRNGSRAGPRRTRIRAPARPWQVQSRCVYA